MENMKKNRQKVQFIVIREFSGKMPMREAFEQAIEHQACERFEAWMEQQETLQEAA